MTCHDVLSCGLILAPFCCAAGFIGGLALLLWHFRHAREYPYDDEM